MNIITTRQLSFKSNPTEQCEKGCYLFLRYSHDNYNFNSRVGFEYTLLTRIWDEEKIDSQIINIPFNEYIFGVFEEDSINHHYYTLSIPENTKLIIIQFEGNHIEGFTGFRKKKLNTFKKLSNTQKINEGENKKIKIIELNESKISDYISFAFRLKNFFNEDFSLYYFRILLLNKNEKNIIYPLDSNVGNFCEPKKEGNEYFCYCLLKNYYNEFSLNYSISTSKNKDKLTYNYFELINGEIKGYKLTNITSASIKKYSNYISIAKFKFENTKYANILSTLSSKKKKIYPQIYSNQMYYFRENKQFIVNLNHKFTLIINYIFGQGRIEGSKYIYRANQNFKGKKFLIPFNEGNNILNFTFTETKESNELIFFTRFEQYNDIKEIIHGEELKEFIDANKFPIYYYIKNGENIINYMNIHFIIKNINDKERNETTYFEINGYIMNENDFKNKRSITGEFIDLKNPIMGSYDICFRNGILNINRTINENNYILIKIDSSSHLNEDTILMEILTMSKVDDYYTLPINYYLTDIYDSTEDKNYKIIIDEKDFKNKEILIDFIPDCSRIIIDKENNSINMINISDNKGNVQNYRIIGASDDFILKVKVPQDISYGTFIIRYYFTQQQNETNYKLNKNFHIMKGNKENDIILEFDKFEIENNNKDTIERKILFKIYGFLYQDENDIKNESFNSSKAIQEKIYKNQALIQKDTNFSLYFSGVKSNNNNNYIFNLYLKIIVFEGENLFNEQFLVYTLPVNLEKELKGKLPKIWIIIISSLVLIIIIIIIIFTIGLIKLKKKNINLKEKVLSVSFTTEKIDEDIIEKDNCKKDEDIENAFI